MIISCSHHDRTNNRRSVGRALAIALLSLLAICLGMLAHSATADSTNGPANRHSHASWAAAAGVKAPELAARMGHGDAAFTQRRYVHALESERSAEVAKLADYRRRARATDAR